MMAVDTNYRDDYGILKMNESSILWMPSYSGSNYIHRALSRNGYFVEASPNAFLVYRKAISNFSYFSGLKRTNPKCRWSKLAKKQ